MPDKIWEELLIWKLVGPRFDEHRGVDLADLAGLVALRTAIVEVAKILWKARHKRKRIPDGAEEAIDLRIKRFEDGSEQATVWLGRPHPIVQAAPQGELYGSTAADFASFFDSIHDAASALEDTLRRVTDNEPLPEWFPREIFRQLHIAGRGLRDNERWSISAHRNTRESEQPSNDHVPHGGPQDGEDERSGEELPIAARAISRPSRDLVYQINVLDRALLPTERGPPREAPLLDAVLRAKLEALGQPKPPEVRVVQRTLSGEVTMVDVDGLAEGRLGRVRIRPDEDQCEPVEIEFLHEHEAFVTSALHEHNNRVHLRVRGDAHLDERGRMTRFVAKRVAQVTIPNPDSYCEAHFERLVSKNPGRLVELLLSNELDPTLLTFAAEIAGRNLPGPQVVQPLLQLLRHKRSIVREGAIYGLRDHLDDDVTSELRRLAETDNSPGVRTAAQGALKVR